MKVLHNDIPGELVTGGDNYASFYPDGNGYGPGHMLIQHIQRISISSSKEDDSCITVIGFVKAGGTDSAPICRRVIECFYPILK